jgi:hypothetical protein
MIKIALDSAGAQDCLQRMADRIEELGRSDIPAELTAWEVEDMHRKYPNTETPDDHSAETEIWPTSRLALARSHRRVIVRHRPILREELRERLRARMVALMEEKLRWR